MDEDFDPTPDGLVRCLQVLAEEAAMMRLTRTFAALQEAIAVCRDECEAMPVRGEPSIAARLVH